MELTENSANMTGSVQSGRILVDGLGVGDVGNIVLRDRQHLSQDGLIIIVLTMDKHTGEVLAGPDIISRGFVYVRESENLMDEVKRTVQRELYRCEEKGITDWSGIMLMPLCSSRRMGEYYMSQILKIGPYVVYFWSNEGALWNL